MSKKLLMRAIATFIAAALVFLTAIPALAAPPLPYTAPPPVVPAAPPMPPPINPVYHIVQWGETLTRIAIRYGTTVWAIAQANGLRNVNYIRLGQALLIPVPGPQPLPGRRTYMVQHGDTLYSIAWRFGTSVWAIVQANGLWNPNYIYIGQRLIIP
jgi:LysM repeat protein